MRFVFCGMTGMGWASRLAAAGVFCLGVVSAQEVKADWTERETRLANEYLSLLVERPEHGRVLELLWGLYEKHDQTKLLLENIRAQAESSGHPAALLIEGHLLRKSGDLKAAAAKYDVVLGKEPQNALALAARAEVASELQQPREALAFRTRLVEALPAGDPGRAGALLELGNLALALEKSADAANAWEAAARERAGDFDFARQVAELLMRAGLPERAAAFYEKLAEQKEPEKRLSALLDLARIHEHADQFARSDAALVQALGLLHFRDGRYAEIFRRRARLHERFGALEDLRNHLLAEGRKSPPSEKALSDLERFSSVTVDPDEQVRWLRELLKIAPDSGEYRWQLVRALLDHDGAGEAAKLLDEALGKPGQAAPQVILLRCEADLRLGKNDDAVARLKTLLAAAASDAETEKQVLAFAQERALDDIIEEVLRLRVERQMYKAEAVFELAAFYRGRRKQAELEALFARFSAAARPDETQRRLNDIAGFLATGDDADQAVIAARKAYESRPDGYEERLRLADLLAERGENDEAAKLLEAAWQAAGTHEQRSDVDERLISLLIGEDAARAGAASERQTDAFNLPSIFTGAGFASDSNAGAKQPVAALVEERARAMHAELMKAAGARGPKPPAEGTEPRILRAAWWCQRAELHQEACDLLRRLAFDPATGRPAELPVEAVKLLLDLALADQNAALALRLLDDLMVRDAQNRVRYVLRRSETMLEGGQRAAGAVSDSLLQRAANREALVPGATAPGEVQFFETVYLADQWRARAAGRSSVREALALLERAYRESPDAEPLLSAITQCLTLLREPEKALALWESAARRAEGSSAAPLLERYGEMLLRMSRLPEFIAVQADLVDRETDVKRRREAFKRFMDRLLFADAAGGELAPTVMKDRLKMVETILKERVRRHPFEGFYHEALAQVYERGGDAERAFAEMKQAYYTAPDTPFSLDQLRGAALKVGDLKSAIYFQKQIAASAGPKEEMAEHRHLVELLEQTFQIAEADRVRRRVESRFAQDAKALDDLAQHYQATGQDEAERRVHEQIARVRPWDARAKLQLAAKCLRLTDHAEAERQLRALLAAVPPGRHWEKAGVEKWPWPLASKAPEVRAGDTQASRNTSGMVLTDLASAVESAPGLEKDEAARLRAFFSFPRPELAALPDDPALARLRAIFLLSRLFRERGGAALDAWIAEWSGKSASSPVESLWALHFSGAHEAFCDLLSRHARPVETLDMEFVFAWLALRSQGMADVLAWASEKERKEEVLQRRQRLVTAAVSLLADEEEFRFEPRELDLLAGSRLVRVGVLYDLLRRLQDRQRYDEALALGEALKKASGQDATTSLVMARVAEAAERWDLQRMYLEQVAAAPEGSLLRGMLYDAYAASLSALRQAAGSATERERVWQEAWARLRDMPGAAQTTLRRRAVVAGLAGATDQAADTLATLVNDEMLTGRDLGDREQQTILQGATRPQERSAPMASFWQETRELGATLNDHGLGSVVAALDEKLDRRWGGLMLGPRPEMEFGEWRVSLLLRRMREASHPARLRLLREFLGPVDLKSESAVELLVELGAKLTASGMAREAMDIYRRLPSRAPTNSDYANSLMQACEAALEIEPGRSFLARLLVAEPQEKPPNIGDETLRERHARFLVMAFDLDELRERAFVEKPTRMLQGRIPPEVPYLRELAVFQERLGDEAGALAAWERLHASFVANSDAGLEPDAEACLHRARILEKQGRLDAALEALRSVAFKEPLSFVARDSLILRASLAARAGKWPEFQELMLVAVEKKSVEAVLALAADLRGSQRGAEALSFLTQAERTLKESAMRFRLRREQLRLLGDDPAWSPGKDRARISGLMRATSREQVALEAMVEWLAAESGGPRAAAWADVLRAEARSGADRQVAALALCALSPHLDESAFADLRAAWKTTAEPDRVCIELAARQLLSAGRPAWAWEACLAAAEVPVLRLDGRKLPLMAQVAAALGDPALMRELFTEVMRMPEPGGGRVREWVLAFEQAGQPALARELLQGAIACVDAKQRAKPDLTRAGVEFYTRQGDFTAAEALLLRDYYLYGMDAARLVVELYRAWGKLDRLDAELPKFFLPSGVEREVRHLASTVGKSTAPAGKPRS